MFRPSTAVFAVIIYGTGLLVRGDIDLPSCKSKKIHVLDIGEYARNSPPCNVSNLASSLNFGIIYNGAEAELVSHKFGQHSTPWYIAQAIKNSHYVTQNVEEADFVYVDSYCYYIWWLAWSHSTGAEQPDSPGDYLVAALQGLLQSERFKKNGGRDYVFQFSHPGFSGGKAQTAYKDLMCNVFKDSMHIVVERGQRNICPTYLQMEKKLLIVPYNPNTIDPAEPYAAWHQPLKPVLQRELLVSSKASCQPFSVNDRGDVVGVGKKMRHDFSLIMESQGADVKVDCGGGAFQYEAFADVLSRMQNSKFCLALPGDSASMRRLTEIFMAGCIPVFAGPPYATMPLAEDVDYLSVGMFYNITDHQSWHGTSKDFMWTVHPTVRPEHQLDAWAWSPDADIQDALVNVRRPSDIIPHLRQIPQEKIDAMFKAVEAFRHRFVYKEHLTHTWSAANSIISSICSKLSPDSGDAAGTSRL